jgi:hypothetical protein
MKGRIRGYIYEGIAALMVIALYLMIFMGFVLLDSYLELPHTW